MADAPSAIFDSLLAASESGLGLSNYISTKTDFVRLEMLPEAADQPISDVQPPESTVRVSTVSVANTIGSLEA